MAKHFSHRVNPTLDYTSLTLHKVKIIFYSPPSSYIVARKTYNLLPDRICSFLSNLTSLGSIQHRCH